MGEGSNVCVEGALVALGINGDHLREGEGGEGEREGGWQATRRRERGRQTTLLLS